MAKLNIGKTKIEVTAAGCVKCGVEFSHGWRSHRRVAVTVDKRAFELDVHVCADCDARQQAAPPTINELQL